MTGKFDQVHFFIDESGKLYKRSPDKRDVLLVGGVLHFGRYSDEDDRVLIKMIDQAIRSEGGTFPESLHFSDSTLQVKQWERVLAALQADISEWQGDSKSMYGIVLSHSADLFNEGLTLLSEREQDNRYVSMLWTLIEHLLFVDHKVGERLTEDATVHLYVASRIYRFQRSSADFAELQALGYRILDDHRDKNMCFVFSMEERELAAMIKQLHALLHAADPENAALTSLSPSACVNCAYNMLTV